MKCASSLDSSVKPDVTLLSLAPLESAQLQPHSSGRVRCFFFFLFPLSSVMLVTDQEALRIFFFLMHSAHAKDDNKGKSTAFLEQETSWTLFPSDILNSLWGLWNKHTTALEQESQSCHRSSDLDFGNELYVVQSRVMSGEMRLLSLTHPSSGLSLPGTHSVTIE